jgi:DNA-binding NtrC family response regulator
MPASAHLGCIETPGGPDHGHLKKILLVDDDDDLREALSEQLVMTEDFDVFEAGSGAQAMERVKEGSTTS